MRGREDATWTAREQRLPTPLSVPSVLAKPLPIREDTAEVPDGPGLGVTVDEAKIAGMRNRSGVSRGWSG